MTSNILAALADDELITECVLAADDPSHDIDGNAALLEEARQRCAYGRLGDEFLQMLDVVLGRSESAIVCDALSPREAVTKALQGLRRGTVPRRTHLFHGTLKSRLVGIAREGLAPGRHAKNWRFEMSSEHTASGVFFTETWRQANNWMLMRANGDPARGAILRLPSDGLFPVKDEFARGSGNLVVRGQTVDVSNAEVLLHPFTVTNSWLTLSQAIDVGRQERKQRRA
ncbi:hypothetical protein [Bosea sp. ANAM02]|uniref:hypothetical protein n=1 Tax=Bosea sp. ANAM02 TaxID=2020412 RepID=UPI00140EF322|nr:hypothetical protein [Bosea sp. ANAM02]BCB21154.1 hypothetical protein OCUBac02_40480 [Bosea sp. ANAM02]